MHWLEEIAAGSTDSGGTMNTTTADTRVTEATLGGWERHVYWERVWGTIVTFDVRGESVGRDVREAVAEAAAFLHDVDSWFSTYRVDTPITALRNGLMAESQAPSVVRQVLDRCRAIRRLTRGAFDPWAVPGGVDPSGFVKGWAADIAAQIVVDHGFSNVSVNAAGDVACRGLQSPDQPWVVGILHPESNTEVVRTVELTECSIATSGLFERGNHIIDPHRGVHEVRLDSATVIGPDGGLADALATALLLEGEDGLRFFAGLSDWSGYLMRGGRASYFGPAFETSSDCRGEIPTQRSTS